MEKQLQQLKDQFFKELAEAQDSQALLEIKERYLSKKGELARLSKGLKDVAKELRPKVGATLNALRQEVEEVLGAKLKDLGESLLEETQQDWLDVTVSIDKYKLGNLHPITQVMRELEDIFKSMGFKVLSGPEIESDYYNFEGLNIPDWHPARDDADTFYLDVKGQEKLLLRTHTSPMQVRAMQQYGAPLRAVVPGRVFRNEATDASHDHTFYQIEGFMVDQGISVSNLIATLRELVSGIYKKEMQVRLRPGYFPFVEPGFELDISCIFCDGQGCSVCKNTGWIEMGGSGLIHPHVLKAGGIDPKKYSGFAFGMGVTRLVMLKYGISDIRLLHSSDLRFLKQF